MHLQSTPGTGSILSGWAQILAHFLGQRLGQGAGGGAEAPSFQEEIARFQASGPAHSPDSGAPAALPDSGLPPGAVPVVAHHLRPIYFGQAAMPQEESDALGRAAMAALSMALESRGVNPADVRMSYVSHYFDSPAGGIPTRMIRVEAGDGRWEEFSADWTLLRPHLTATEIETRVLGGSRPELT